MKAKTLLVIPGLPRCGTTSLVSMLMQHPEVYHSKVKEPHTLIPEAKRRHLFGLVSGKRKLFSALGFLDSMESYYRNYNHFKAPGIYIDASTLYSVHPEFMQGVEAISSNFDVVKFIVMTRDPFRRAESHYRFSLSRGEEYRSFRQAILDEFSNSSGFEHWLLGGYVRGSSAADVIDAIQSRYPSSLMTIDIDTTDIYSQSTQNTLCDFLGISHCAFSKPSYENRSELYATPFVSRFRILMKRIRDINPMIMENRFTRWVFRVAISLMSRLAKKDLMSLQSDSALYMEKFQHGR